jgi:hypothetical protein
MCIVLTLLLCGCDLLTADTAELLSPPSLSGDLKYISQAVKESAGSGYTLKYPSRGSYRSAVVQKDVNNDGVLEAFAFYSMTDGDVVTMHINVIHKDGEDWVSAGEQHVVAGGVDKVEFSDLDGDGVLDIIVGWEIYGASEKQLAIYSFTENIVTQRMLQKYTDYVVCNLDMDSKNEVLVIDFNSAELKNTAWLVYATTSLIALFLLGNIQIAIEYIIFAAYPILKPIFEKAGKLFGNIIKYIFMALSSISLTLLFRYVFLLGNNE